jgi:Ca-activated chloride channel family protein
MNLAQPGWLVLLLLIPLLGIGALLVARLRRAQWQGFVAPRLRPNLLRRASTLPRWIALLFCLAATASLVAALSRPQGDAGTKTEKSLGRNVLIALDLSRSMRVTDVKPDRLSQAKVVLYELLDAMPGDRVGLIGFAGSPFLHAPITVDQTAVRETIEQMDETWAPLGGSDISSAIRMAIDVLKETGQKNNALVILSDGEEHEGDLDSIIADADQAGVYIFAIGVGTEDGAFVPHRDFPGGRLLDENGNPILSRLQPQTLRKLAEETGGRYAVAGSGVDITQLVKSAVSQLDAFEVEGRERRVAIEFYQWLILPAILFLFVSIIGGTRWRPIRATALLGAAFLLPHTPARANDEENARQALNSGRLEEARDAYKRLAEKSSSTDRSARFRLGQATAAYRNGEFRAAREAYSDALLSKNPDVTSNAHLGTANSLFQLGWQTLSEESYPHNPDEIPDLDRFDTLVREKLARILDAEPQDDKPTPGIQSFENLVIDWADATRHFDSALTLDPTNQTARTNRKVTLTYLNRLRELLKQESEETEQSLPQEGEGQPEPQPGEGEPQEGEGEGEPQEGEGEPREPGDQENPGDQGEEPNDQGEGGENPEDKPGENGENGEEEKPSEGPSDETPEERARRILSENSDLERGPLAPGKLQQFTPEKDW